MRGLRFITDNVADTAALTATSTVAGLGAENLKTDYRSQVMRVSGPVTVITAVWSELQTVGGVVIPASSLGPSSTIQVRFYSDSTGISLLHDTGQKWAAPGPIFANQGFMQPLNVNAFAYGIPPTTAVYPPQQLACRRVEIILESPGAAYIDISRLVIGRCFSPKTNADWGQADGIVDLTVNTRTAAGDLKSDRGPVAKKLTFDLGFIEDVDRAEVKAILNQGLGKFVFVSLSPEDPDPVRERDKSIYGKLSESGTMTWASFNLHTANFDIEGF